MLQEKNKKIKMAVLRNFDLSPVQYDEFETRHGFFRDLNAALIRFMNLSDRVKVLDVGCGTGASSKQMLESIKGCRVWGLDNSSPMLKIARSNIGVSERLDLVLGDASRLTEYFDFLFDAVVFSASIFLVPDYQDSLQQVQVILKSGGVVGITFMDGIYSSDGLNLFALADSEANEGVSLKKPVDIEEFRHFFSDTFPCNRSRNQDFSSSEELLRQFFSIPAMSAGLFPGFEYEERVRKVGKLFDHMPKTDVIFRWVLMVGVTSPSVISE